jgi:hypothetical protein
MQYLKNNSNDAGQFFASKIFIAKYPCEFGRPYTGHAVFFRQKDTPP